ncbi:hypothetical protein PILCRDRAFT_121458 [Piloderma croceum F 1598]|uniref:Uncharacterized protein n=1 Tax=Piloderma croceum (strain F 1598) TaxID=765440 RepID=A0A0C3GPA2_PILCF|nr:hypothetical protein PILCRDRAFT_121458 [Piloderma croceum F 1598]
MALRFMSSKAQLLLKFPMVEPEIGNQPERAFPPVFQAVSCTLLLFRILFDGLTSCQRKDGIAKIDIDNAYVRQHGYDSVFDELVMRVIAGTEVRHGEFLEPLQRLMSENPSEASKFSTQAFEVLGDFAIA